MEEDIALAETEKADNASNEGAPSEDVPNNSPVKRGRGRPQGSKKLKVCLSDVIPPELAAAEPDRLGEEGQNGDSAPKPRGRGRPKGSKKKDSEKSVTDHSPRKRGRPRKALSQSTAEKPPDLPNGGTEKRKRGRPKGSVKRKLDSSKSGEESVSSPAKLSNLPNGGTEKRKRGRPKGSVKRKLDSSVSESSPATPRKRGRPKGSLNKKPSVYKAHRKVGRPRKVLLFPARGKKRGRPRLHPLPAKRGRPRKYPLPSPEELKKPKVWKPLGRPRKYPRVDPPEGVQPAPRRGRGRPCKSESKKGAHLRKNPPTVQKPDGPPRKRGRPKKTEDGSPQKKRGRPKGSVNKTKSAAQLDGALANDSEEKGEALGNRGAIQEEAVGKADISEAAPTGDTLIGQDASCDVSGRA